MGPRLFSRGKDSESRIIAAGGVSTLQWGHDFSAVESAADILGLKWYAIASMGPRLFSRGKFKHFWCFPFQGDALQWGHDFSAVER